MRDAKIKEYERKLLRAHSFLVDVPLRISTAEKVLRAARIPVMCVPREPNDGEKQ